MRHESDASDGMQYDIEGGRMTLCEYISSSLDHQCNHSNVHMYIGPRCRASLDGEVAMGQYSIRTPNGACGINSAQSRL